MKGVMYVRGLAILLMTALGCSTAAARDVDGTTFWGGTSHPAAEAREAATASAARAAEAPADAADVAPAVGGGVADRAASAPLPPASPATTSADAPDAVAAAAPVESAASPLADTLEAADGAQPPSASVPLPPAAPAAGDNSRRCTGDGRVCIHVETYVTDVCSAIETAATESRLDPNFLARLLWKESMFEPEAVSPVGAQGIAQFMPETARIRQLDDPFNPAKAIFASAAYLRYLIDGFGNMGLAAVAYNGGETRALNFFNGGTVLPYETQDYVEAITGHNAWKWRDEPPQDLDLRLDKQASFRDACIKLAGRRQLKEFSTKARAWPWGVILAAHPKQSGAQQQVNRLNRQLRPILGGKRISYVRKQIGGSARRVYTAQIGYSSKIEAFTFCNQLRALGGRCIVLRN